MEIKRGWLVGSILFMIIFIIPIVYAGFFDFFGIEDITGRDAVTASISMCLLTTNLFMKSVV